MLDEWFQEIANNADFYSNVNLQFYVRVLNEFNFTTKKIIVFLPCAKQKPISKSRTHCYLSPITRNPNYEKIILSEPQTVIPYSLEQYCPAYDYPPGDLTDRDRWQLRRRLAIFLGELRKHRTGKMEKIYYIGGLHHFEILYEANRILEPDQFILFGRLPKRGIRDYTVEAKAFVEFIDCLESSTIFKRRE